MEAPKQKQVSFRPICSFEYPISTGSMTRESSHAPNQVIFLILEADIGDRNGVVELWARDVTMKLTNASRKSRKILSPSFSYY
jgi:hypothetical protein